MTPLQIARRNLRQHLVATVVTCGSIALACGLLLAVWVLKDSASETFARVTGGYDAVLGPRSSDLQLVLNTVFHLETSPGNIQESDFAEIKSQPAVASAVPISVGDNFKGFRVVGTTLEMFRGGEVERAGRFFDPQLREAVVGSYAAKKLGLKPGDRFRPYHGLAFNEKERHEEEYVVVGILKPSNSPSDRVIWIPLEGLQRMGGHRAESINEISAVLVKLTSPIAGKTLQMKYRQGDRLTFVWPIGAVTAQLFEKINWFEKILVMLAYLVSLVAAGSILASLYNSLEARRRDIAILRALGATRHNIFSVLFCEATAIGVLGAAAGFLVYFAIMVGAGAMIRAQTGVRIDPLILHPVLLWGPAGIVFLSGLAGWLPAWKAYQTDVAGNLAPAS